MAENPDWFEWHRRYEPAAGSHLPRRLAAVQAVLARTLDEQPPGKIRVASLCAGQGDDLLGVLQDHPRRLDVRAALIESDARNAAVMRSRIEALDLSGVGPQGDQAHGVGRVVAVEGDAGTTSALAAIVPVDVLLLCGMFGNISMTDIETTIDATPSLLAPAGTVIWTRRSVPTDLTPQIRARFALRGFTEIDFVNPDDNTFTVGCQRLARDPEPFVADRRLFDFIGYATMIERGE